MDENLDAGDVEQALAGYSMPDGANQAIVDSYTESASQLISRAIQLFFSSSVYDELDQVYLAGGVAKLGGLTDLLEQKIGVPVTVADPFCDGALQMSPKIDGEKLKSLAPSMLVACGLAMREY